MLTLRKKLLKKIKSVLYFVFPLLKIKNFPQLLNSDLIFHNRCDVKAIITGIFTFLVYFELLISGFRVPLFKELHLLSEPVLGAIGRFIYFLASFAVCEVILVRIWIYFKLKKCKSAMKIDFIHLILEAKPSVHQKILFWLKMLFSKLQLGGYAACLILVIAEFSYADNLIKFCKSIFWLFGSFHLIRIGLQDVVILISFTFAGLNVLFDEINEMAILLESSLTRISVNQLVYKYLYYIKSITRMNGLTKYLLFVNNLFNIPFTSVILYSFSIRTDGSLQNISKFLAYIPAITYCFRVYMLTSILSKVDRESKQIYSDINSAIARGKSPNYNECRQLLLIMEDMASERNHFVIREYNDTVTEMDTFNNIVNTLSIAALYYSFDQLARKFVTF